MCNRSLHSNNRRFEVERPKRHNFHLLTRLLISRGYLSPKRYDKLVLPPGGGGGAVHMQTCLLRSSPHYAREI